MIKTKKRLDRKRDANANANAAAGLNRCFSPGTGRWWAAGSWDYLSGACSPLLEWWAAGRRWGWTCTRWVVEQRRNQEVSCAKTEQGRDSTVNPCPPSLPHHPTPVLAPIPPQRSGFTIVLENGTPVDGKSVHGWKWRVVYVTVPCQKKIKKNKRAL